MHIQMIYLLWIVAQLDAVIIAATEWKRLY